MSLDEFITKFRALFPEFSSVNDATLEVYYEQSLAIFGKCSYAQLYLAAHLIALDEDSGVGSTGGDVDGGQGEITQEKVGDLQVTLMTMADKSRTRDVYFTTTAYGRRYLTFRNSCPSYAFSGYMNNGTSRV